jgi:hypothetical protein
VPRQAAVGPAALRQLICDTTKVNTGAAETTRADRDIAELERRSAELRHLTNDSYLAPSLRNQRERAELARIETIIRDHRRHEGATR